MKLNRTVPMFTIILIAGLVILNTLLVSCRPSETSEDNKRNHPSAKQVNIVTPNFVPGNNDVIIFNYSTVFWSKIATFNLKTGEFKGFDNIKIKQVKLPISFPDGKKIAFLGAHDEYGHNRNIY